MKRIGFRRLGLCGLMWALCVSMAPATTHAAITADVGQKTTYTVRAGDTLPLIAQWFRTTPEAFMAANNLASPEVSVGLALSLPLGSRAVAPVLVAPDSTDGFYRVQAGDSLFFIGRRYGDSVANLKAVNRLPSAVIYVGLPLILPSMVFPSLQAAPRVAATSGLTPAGVLTSSLGSQTYVVVSGDSLYKIALRYGTTWQMLAAVNGLTKPYRLRVGQVVNIPAGLARSP